MRWMDNLYIGEKLKADRETLIREGEEDRPRPGLYILSLPANPRNMLEIRKAGELRRKRVKESLPEIVGLAADKQEAFELVQKMVELSLQQYGSEGISRLFEQEQSKCM